MKCTPRLGTLLAGIVLVLNPAAAQDSKPVELRYAAVSPPKSIWADQVERLAKAIDEESRGALKLQPFLNGQLGNEQDTVQQVARGRIDMGGFSNNAVALLVPELSLIPMPLYYRNPTEVDCVLDTALTRPVTELLAAKGLQFLGWGEAGTLDLVGKKPYLQPSDLNGMKAGTYGTKVYAMFWSGLGANPTQMSAPEATSAFQTGLVDVWATVASYYVPAGVGKVAPVLTRLDVAPLPILTLMNKAVYDKLSGEQQQALLRSLQRAPANVLRKEVRDFENLVRGLHEKNGGQVVSVTSEQREPWRKLVAPMWPRMAQEAGPGGARFFELMEAGRKACEKAG